MKDFLLVLLSIALTAVSWGVYGPLMREGQAGMGNSHLLPFIMVGVAYFAIAVVAAGAVLALRGESGKWTKTGTIWSLVAGIVTAVGALGIILAFKFGGSPLYVMPLVFGCAPVINTFLTMFMTKTYKQAQPVFYAGLILVIAGAVTVLVTKPAPLKPAVQASAAAPGADPGEGRLAATHRALARAEARVSEMTKITLFIALTAVCWGAYGPMLHRGQVAMGGSRLRPFICVGIAYFLIAVLAPLPLLGTEHGALTASGTLWSLAGGTAGALGSLGIILAFNFGGKPIYVMPLVFGGAPVVNTLTSIATAKNLEPISAPFYAGLIVVLAGAITVLIFAPKPGRKPAAGTSAAGKREQPVGSH